MTELINVQANMLVVSIGIGAIMGLIYDIIRCIRRIVAHNLFFVSVEDFIYWFAMTLFVIDSIVSFNYGQLRIYIFIAIAFGFVVYRITIGWVLMKTFNYMWCPIKKCLHNIKKSLKINKKDSKI